MNPIIYTFHIFGYELPLRWYGVLVALGIAVAAWLAEKEVQRRGENPEHVWNALTYLLPIGLIGARLWYVVNATIGGNPYYLQNPAKIIAVWEGGLHIYGGFLFGALTLFWYVRKHGLDMWLFLDAIAPVTLIGQAVARPANFINQELYGPPTSLPWGILINRVQSRVGVYKDLAAYPLETTRFHPTFAYEMIWNFLSAGILLWALRRWPEKFKPAAAFGWWLVLAGTGRALIELFRPDQPLVAGTPITTSQLVSLLMALAGIGLLLLRSGRISLPGVKLPETYKISR
ncbi:MAG: prolipoprotein diacylglyceryl transferase [Anaerolineales bacterium]